jgi:Immunity protein 35
MEDREEARQIVEKYVNENYKGANGPLVVVDEDTWEKPYGWIFFYCTKKWWETRDIRYLIAGNGPVVFEKNTQKIYQLGTAGGPVEQVHNWEMENFQDG